MSAPYRTVLLLLLFCIVGLLCFAPFQGRHAASRKAVRDRKRPFPLPALSRRMFSTKIMYSTNEMNSCTDSHYTVNLYGNTGILHLQCLTRQVGLHEGKESEAGRESCSNTN